jgi:hypothetical protein
VPKVCRSCCSTPTTITGNVLSCFGTALAASGMNVGFSVGMTSLGSTTTNSAGAYSATISITGTVVVTVTVTPLSSRFAVSSGNQTVTAGVSTSKNVQLVAGLGYACFGTSSVVCAYPIQTSLTVTIGSPYGGFVATATYSAGTWTAPATSVAYGGYTGLGCGSACPSGTVTLTCALSTGTIPPGGFVAITYNSDPSTCGPCPGIVSTHKVESPAGQPVTCPGASGTPTFVLTGTISTTGGLTNFPATLTVIFQE